jgi:hypothetical protein
MALKGNLSLNYEKNEEENRKRSLKARGCISQRVNGSKNKITGSNCLNLGRKANKDAGII